MTLTDYLVTSALSTQIFVAEDLKPTLSELKRIGNNLNQIATRVNMGVFQSYNFSEVIQWQRKLYEELVRIGGTSGDCDLHPGGQAACQCHESRHGLLPADGQNHRPRNREPVCDRAELQRRECLHGISRHQDCLRQAGRHQFLPVCPVLFAQGEHHLCRGPCHRVGVCGEGLARA